MIISTTKNSPWQVGETTDKKGIKLEFGDTHQTIRGFGTAFSELGAKALNSLSKKDYDKVIGELFDSDKCNFNYCRTPIGSSDFSLDYYSYDDFDGDYEMKRFSVERDEKLLIPLIKDALSKQSDMQMFASPWCPPIWMKTRKAYSNGIFNMTKENLKAYALYFRKYVEEYHKRSIPIIHIFPQNEPCSNQRFPSCVWSGKDLTEFVGSYLGPELENTGCEIFFGTINGPETDERYLRTRYHNYLGYAMLDKKARKYIKGVGYQWAGRGALLQTHDDYPDLEIIQTESECGDGRNDYYHMMYIFEVMRTYFRHGVSAYVYWNIALEEDNSSTWGWNQNSLVHVVNSKPVFTPEFYLMKHFSHFVKRNARYIDIKGEFSSNCSAFVNPDGSKVICVSNPYDTQVTITIDKKSFILPEKSINTIVL